MAKKKNIITKVKYIVYCEGSDNTSDIIDSKKKMITVMKKFAINGDWDGLVIGYKCIPIFKIDIKDIPIIPIIKVDNK